MGRERFAIALLLSAAAVFGGAAGCNGDRAAPPPSRAVVAAAGALAHALDSDTVSGCVQGAALAKVLVDLKPEGDRCVAEVTPASVCVAAGGAVRFKVQNGCTSLGGPDRPALEITRASFKRPLGREPAPVDPPPLFPASCALKVQRIDKGGSHVLFCDVAEDAYEGFYKYGLTGQIVTVDPDVEVRPGRK
jgi:hypothetical protein